MDKEISKVRPSPEIKLVLKKRKWVICLLYTYLHMTPDIKIS